MDKTPKTKSVVINNCYGGFGISNEALLQLIKKNSPIVKIMTMEEYAGKDWKEDAKKYPLASTQTKFKEGFFQEHFSGTLSKNNNVYFLKDDYRDYSTREHPDLVTIVGRLGKKANGQCADLKIIRIPANVKYTIKEYDGIEWVAEKHKTWS